MVEDALEALQRQRNPPSMLLLLPARVIFDLLRAVRVSREIRIAVTLPLLNHYAKSYMSDSYFEFAHHRGVVVHKVEKNYHEGTPEHHMFSLFPRGEIAPIIEPCYRNALVQLKRLKRDLFDANLFDFAEAVFHRSTMRARSQELQPSIGSMVLGLPECHPRVNRNDLSALIMKIVSLEMEHPDLLSHPPKPTPKVPKAASKSSVIKHMAVNASAVDEEPVEFINALVRFQPLPSFLYLWVCNYCSLHTLGWARIQTP